jgi:hypothetical protein
MYKSNMTNSMIETILRHKKLIPVVVALAAVGAYIIPANSLALGAAISGSGNVVQTQTQSNSISATNSGKYGSAFADFNFQLNDAANSAVVAISNDPAKIKDSGNVLQSIDQSNSITADNTGDFGTASASDNTQVNSASNDASVSISNDPSGGNYHHHHGDTIKNSGNVIQSIDQSNSISASNSGASGTATADHNTQVNDAHNHADVSVSNSGHHDKIKDSGNVVQSISQSNSDSASNSGDHGTASASHNTQVNSASNDAHVNVSNK